MEEQQKLKKVLKELGLSEKEANIYFTLLELKEAQPSVIAKRSGIKRPTTYVTLDNLKKKGLVSHFKKDGHTFYRSSDPSTLLKQQEKKLKELKNALPELKKLNLHYKTMPQMSIYEGKEGLIKIMEDTLTTSTELLCWANPSVVYSLLEDYYPSYVEKKVKRKIWLRGVFCHDEIGEKFKKKGDDELREIYLIPKEHFPFENEINIYDDKVAIISHEDEVGLIIQNKAIADTQRAIFELGFKAAKILEKNPNALD